MIFQRKKILERKAKFLVIGAQKCGTTALHRYLSKHPDLISPIKEIRFFNCDLHYQQGIGFYHRHFIDNPEKPHAYHYDTSPGYLNNPKSAARIYKYNKEAKLIILLRDPAQRAFSAWNMYRARFKENPEWFRQWMNHCSPKTPLIKRNIELFEDFTYVIQEELKASLLSTKKVIQAPLISHGFYYNNICRYLKYFSEKQLLILKTVDLSINTSSTLGKIEDFLQISKHNWEKENLTPEFSGDYAGKVISMEQSALLNSIYQNDKLNLEAKFGITF